MVQSHVDIFSCTVVLEYADPSMSVRNKLGHGVSRDGCACFPACHAAFFNFAVLFRVPAFLYKNIFSRSTVPVPALPYSKFLLRVPQQKINLLFKNLSGF